MRKISAIAAGFVAWLIIFLILQLIGYSLWDMQPNNIPSDIVVGFLSSLIALLLAEELMKAIEKTLKRRFIGLVLAALVSATYALMLSFGPRPEAGYAHVLAAFGASLVPFIISVIRPDA